MKVALIIPTLNASRNWQPLEEGIRRQSHAPDQVVVIDSSSDDDTVARAKSAGFAVVQTNRAEFSHGGTRQAAAQCIPNADILIYLTQDSIPHGTDSFRNIVSAFQDSSIGAAFGRQIPHAKATAIETHARLFNYPSISFVRSLDSRAMLGFKSIFFSNAFGAYRRHALMEIGGFSPDVDFGEDTLAIAQLHRAGWKTAYVADALVEHSHGYSMWAEFRRYVQIGTLHRREHWLIEQFGTAAGEGRRFVVSEMKYLWKHSPIEIPSALMRSLVKYMAYRVGLDEVGVTSWLRHRMSI
jgi:rhamnosyltransferase